MATKTVNEHTQRQAEGLKRLRTRLGLKPTQVAGRLGYDSSQAYEAYERARSVLRLDQVARWAEAFDVSEAEFLRELGFMVDEPAEVPWSVRATLETAGLPPDLIDGIEADTADTPEQNQRVAVAEHIQLYHERQARAESERQTATA